MKVLTMQLNSTSVMDIVAYGGAAVGMAVAVSEFLKGNLTVSGTLCIVLLASEFSCRFVCSDHSSTSR